MTRGDRVRVRGPFTHPSRLRIGQTATIISSPIAHDRRVWIRTDADGGALAIVPIKMLEPLEDVDPVTQLGDLTR